MNCLPFFSRIHHFAPNAPNACALCGEAMGDNPIHLLVNCRYKKDVMILLRSHSPQIHSNFSTQRGAFLVTRRLSIGELIHHCAFAKTMWKARCTAVYTNTRPNPHLIELLYRKLVNSLRIPNATPSLIPLVDDITIKLFLEQT